MPAQLSYKTLREENSAEFIINKSRFIGYGCPCETEEEALAFLARIRQKHKDATHNCYAYIIGLNSGIMRYSDDGEPARPRLCAGQQNRARRGRRGRDG